MATMNWDRRDKRKRQMAQHREFKCQVEGEVHGEK